MIEKKEISPERALQRAQALCAKQERCTNDVRKKLYLWKLTENEANYIINKLTSDGFVDDERFARIFVRDKSKFNKWGPIKIVFALKSKKIDAAIIKLALEEANLIDEPTLKELLTKKMKSIKAKTPYDMKVKLIRFGVSRGYQYEVVNKIASLLCNEY